MTNSNVSRSVFIIIGAAAALIVPVVLLYAFGGERGSGRYDEFAKCINESGAVFYGAFWCPHCQNQKKLFGPSAKYLPYVECSTPDGRGQTAYCDEKNIDGYPTWEFKDGSRLSRELSFAALEEKTGCSPLQTATSSAATNTQ